MCFRKLLDALKLYPNCMYLSAYLGRGAMRFSKGSRTKGPKTLTWIDLCVSSLQLKKKKSSFMECAFYNADKKSVLQGFLK